MSAITYINTIDLILEMTDDGTTVVILSDYKTLFVFRYTSVNSRECKGRRWRKQHSKRTSYNFEKYEKRLISKKVMVLQLNSIPLFIVIHVSKVDTTENQIRCKETSYKCV